MPIFDDVTIEQIFGAEDAENEDDERFKQYFFYNRAYDSLNAELPIRILVGHKGIGKSALLRRSYLTNLEECQLAVWIRPNDLISNTTIDNNSEFNQLIEAWKTGLLSTVAMKSIENFLGDKNDNKIKNLVVSGTQSIINFLKQYLEQNSSQYISNTSSAIVDNFRKDEKIYIYIDDIDRGWSASRDDINNISALLNAIRDICGSDKRIRVKIGLRSDVYYLVRTSDESTDKIERNVIWLRWTNHEILSVIAKRIETFFESKTTQEQILNFEQSYISRHILSKVIVHQFEGRGRWKNRPIHNVLLSMTRKRPRDLVKIMQGSAKNAYASGNLIIQSSDLQRTFEPYSEERLRDIINEFRSEVPQIEALLLNMRPTKKEIRTSDSFLFTTGGLIKKLKQVIGHTNLTFRNGANLTEKSLIQFLYKIDFITARKLVEDRIDRKYFDQSRFLANEFVDFGYDWEVHPAYRWALQPQDISNVLDSIHEEIDRE